MSRARSPEVEAGGLKWSLRYVIESPEPLRFPRLLSAGGVFFLVEEHRLSAYVPKGKKLLLRASCNRPHGGKSAWARVGPTDFAFLGGGGTRAAVLLRWNESKERFEQEKLPDLPCGLYEGSAFHESGELYLLAFVGADRRKGLKLLVLDLGHRARGWRELPAPPGGSLAVPLLAVQHDGLGRSLYALAVRLDTGGSFVTDVYRLSLRRPGRDSKRAGWKRGQTLDADLASGLLAPFGQSHLIGACTQAGEVKERLFFYHTITDTWVSAGEPPEGLHSGSITFCDGTVFGLRKSSGSEESGPQTWEVHAAVWSSARRPFGAVNISILILYLFVVLAAGLYLGKWSRDTEDYFRGGKRLPWWAAGCSIFATILSSITYVAIPAKAYAQDWVYLPGNLSVVIAAPIVVLAVLPHYRRLDVTSAYEYLERRFTAALRFFGAGVFILFHLFRMAIVMSLASLALASLTGMPAWGSVLVMGCVCTLYCTSGGIRAVVWTDTIQTGVLLGGAFLCFVTIVLAVPGGLETLAATAYGAGKLRTFNWHLDPTDVSLAFWVVILGGAAQQLAPYTADQGVVQRYMTTPDSRLAARSLWTAAALSIPASVLFFALGTALFVFYRFHPQRLDPAVMTDQILPLFISLELPPGVGGLVVAGIFAAAQSTVSTSMNAVASSMVTDFLERLGKRRSGGSRLHAARLVTVAAGGLGTLLGLLFINPTIKSLWDSFILILGLCMGVLAGLFLLGMLNRRASAPGALAGAIAGTAVVCTLALASSVVGYLFAAVGIACVWIVGWAASVLYELKGRKRRR